MSEQERIRLLLDVQEHPGNYSDEQLERLLADEEMAALFEEVALMKRALVRRDLGHSTTVSRRSFVGLRYPIFKVAASIVGVVVVTGIAFAAIRVASLPKEVEVAQAEQIEPAKPVAAADTVASDTVAVQPIIYDNTPLERMLPEIGAHYGVEVVFENDDVRGLRFRFVWHPERGIDQVVGDLNQFERLTVRLKDHQITVE